MHFRQIMLTLGLNLHDDSLRDTPGRVAKMYVEEVFSGLDPSNKPDITLFNNSYKYSGMLIEKHLFVFVLRTSFCTHCWKGARGVYT